MILRVSVQDVSYVWMALDGRKNVRLFCFTVFEIAFNDDWKTGTFKGFSERLQFQELFW